MEEAEPSPNPPPPTYLEVICKSSGKTRRFAVGTDAGFALSLINRRLELDTDNKPLAFHIEAIKEGEEPIAFGPNSNLVDYGHGWKLQTVTHVDLDYAGVRRVAPRISMKQSTGGSNPAKRLSNSKPGISIVYIGKIMFAFMLIFVLGVIFTLALDNLPILISFVKSSM